MDPVSPHTCNRKYQKFEADLRLMVAKYSCVCSRILIKNFLTKLKCDLTMFLVPVRKAHVRGGEELNPRSPSGEEELCVFSYQVFKK